jgi:methyl-accepting chemotaxis protein
MPALLQVCIVIVTIGAFVIALITVRMMARFFTRAAEDISQLTLAVRESVEQIELAARDVRALSASLQGCVQPVQRVADRFEAIGQRTADLSSTLLEELERPVFAFAAVSRGVKSAADFILKRVMHRSTPRNSPVNGDLGHE